MTDTVGHGPEEAIRVMAKFRSRTPIRREDAATAVEYAIMVSLIAVVVIVAVWFIGQQTKSDFDCTGSVVFDPQNASLCGG